MQNKNFFTKTRWLVTIILLTTLCIGQLKAASYTSSVLIYASSGDTYASKQGWSNGTQYDQVVIDPYITADRVGGGNNAKYYTDWRFYTNNSGSGSFSINATNGATLSSVTFTYTVSNNGALYDYSSNTKLTPGTAYAISGTSKTFKVKNTNSNTNGQVKITAISVTYTRNCAGTQLDMPNVTATPSSGQISLSWPAVTNATKYKVSWNGCAYTDATSPVTKTSLTNGTSYTWKVIAIGNGTTYCNSEINEGITKAGSPYTITWKVNGTTYATTSVANGDHLVLPPSPSPCIDGKIFAGWSASTISGTTDDKPTFVSSQTTINAAQTYHAVFATPTSNSYTKGDINDLFPGQTTLIVNNSNNKALSKEEVSGQSDKRLKSVSVSPSSNIISSMSNSNLIWTVENRGQKYNFKIGSSYLRATDTGNDKLSYSSGADPWTLTANSGTYYFNSNSSGTSRLQYYNSGPYFNTYGTNSTGNAYAMAFYVPTCSGYFTSCSPACDAPTGLSKGSFSAGNQNVSWTAPGSAPTNGYLVAYSTATSTAPNDNVYSTSGNYTVVAVAAGTTNVNIPCTTTGTYNWWVRSKCSADNSSLSSWVPATGQSFTMTTVYLKNTVNWANAYVSFYSSSYWDASDGTGSSRASGSYVADPAAMTYTESTGLFSYICPSGYTYASFAKDKQDNYGNFYETEAIYCDNDFQFNKVVVPTTQSGTATHHSTKYYKTYTYETFDNGKGTGYYCAGDFNSFETLGNEFTIEGGVLTYTKTLSANTRYGFKVYHHGEYWRNSGAFVHSITDWVFENTDGYNTYFISGPAGTYTFIYDQNDHEVSVTYPDCDHPCANYAYFENTNSWSNVYAHIYDNSTSTPISAWHGVPLSLTQTICGHTYYYGAVECSNYDKVKYNDGGSNEIDPKNTSSCSGKHSDASTTAWTAFTTYTISYAAGTGGSGSMTSHTNLCPGSNQALSPNDFERDHYHFTGWVANVDVKIGGATVTAGTLIAGGSTIQDIRSNITLTAQWEINSHTLTWNWNGGSTSSESYTTGGTKNYGTTITYPANNTMSKTGYNFSSWSSSPSGNPTSMPDADLTITANWTAKEYSVTLDREGASTGSTSVTMTYNSASHTAITAPSKTGYTFGGWYTGEGGTGTQVMNTSGTLQANVSGYTGAGGVWTKTTTPTTLYAKWTAKNYTVTLNDGSGSGGDGTVSVKYDSNTNISDVTVPTYTGNDFRGYYTSTGGGGTKVINGNGEWITGTAYVDAGGNWVYDGSPTLHAYWTAYTYENYRTMCAPVTCGAPDLSSPTPTAYGATISWTDAGKAGTLDHYEYAVWADGAVEPTSGFTSTGTTKSATVSGLLSNTLYNYKVRRVCSGDDNSPWSSGTFTTSYVALTFSVPTGASAVAGQNSNVALPDAEVPTDCGDCWVFVGWTMSEYAASSSAPAKLFASGAIAHLAQADGSTLYAVYQRAKYQRVSSNSDLVANEIYALAVYDENEHPLVLSNTGQIHYPNDGAVTDYNSYYHKVDDDHIYLYNLSSAHLWKFTGTYSSGQLQNMASSDYLNISDADESVYGESCNLTFANSTPDAKAWDISYSTSTYLHGYADDGYTPKYGGFEILASASWNASKLSSYIFKRIENTYATTPDCPKYTVTWDINNGASTSTTDVTKCQGYLSSLPDAPSNTTLSSCQTNGKFMGWSPTKVMPAQDIVPTGMFNDVEYAPEITENVRFYAVFAEEHSGSTGATNRTYTFTSASWGDDASAWTSGAAGNWNSSAVQVTKNKTGANATTISSYNAVTKVTVTYFTNASSGAGSIDIKVNGTSYTGGASVTNSGGTTPRTIDFTPPSSALDGAVKITVTCSDNSIYIKSVQIFYTGSTTTYDQYRTACCTDPQLKFLDGEGDPTTEYVIVREDLASASSVVEIGCDISSLNTTEDITWKQTKRIKTDYHTANTWNASQTDRCQIDITNHKISAYETGSWQITIEQLMGSTNYCDGTATVNILVKTIDKFIDAVNGNFSGEAQSLEDVGNGIILPTEATFSTNNGCADGTTRRLIGWIKASDLATYASGRRVDMIDDLKTGDASNKVIAPGTKVQATGVTWYAVWGVEK